MTTTDFFSEHPTWQVMHHLVTSFYLTQALAVVAELGVADLLQGGAKSTEELACAMAVDEAALWRLCGL